MRQFLARQALKGLDGLERHLHPLSGRLQQDPAYRFQSWAEVDLAARWGYQIDANRASVDDWLRLPGISIHQARTLVQLGQRGLMLTCLEDVATALAIPVESIQPLAKILRFCYYESAGAILPGKGSANAPVLTGQVAVPTLNVNRASLDQLQQIPAIDLNFAKILVYHRQHYGPYRDWVDLKQRLDLTPKLLMALLHYVRF